MSEPHHPQRPEDPSSSSLPQPTTTITKASLIAELAAFLGARGVSSPAAPPDPPTYGQRTAVRREAFDAFQRWIDRPRGSHINFAAPAVSHVRLLPWHVCRRMQRELGRDVVCVFHAPPASWAEEAGDGSVPAKTIDYLALLLMHMLHELPDGVCEKGALIQRDMRGLMYDDGRGGDDDDERRFERGLKAVMWLVLQLGPGAAFFLDGGTSEIDRRTAEALVEVLMSPELRNKLWLYIIQPDAADTSSSYQEVIFESREFIVRSFDFSLAPPASRIGEINGGGGGMGGGCRRISELNVRMPPKEPHPVRFTKEQGRKSSNFTQRLREWMHLFHQ
ncbi:hypothetical protein F4810DRAFT_710421 [Camillea tinctor]|nr:hypothetical protein F4810DRAFT_710421 [Camillea tinctor]